MSDWKTPYIGEAQITKILLSLTISPGTWTFFSKTQKFPLAQRQRKSQKMFLVFHSEECSF